MVVVWGWDKDGESDAGKEESDAYEFEEREGSVEVVEAGGEAGSVFHCHRGGNNKLGQNGNERTRDNRAARPQVEEHVVDSKQRTHYARREEVGAGGPQGGEPGSPPGQPLNQHADQLADRRSDRLMVMVEIVTFGVMMMMMMLMMMMMMMMMMMVVMMMMMMVMKVVEMEEVVLVVVAAAVGLARKSSRSRHWPR